ncbi:hypothetical protein CLOM_g550, partial [Closterium sp. NIES-68]
LVANARAPAGLPSVIPSNRRPLLPTGVPTDLPDTRTVPLQLGLRRREWLLSQRSSPRRRTISSCEHCRRGPPRAECRCGRRFSEKQRARWWRANLLLILVVVLVLVVLPAAPSCQERRTLTWTRAAG